MNLIKRNILKKILCSCISMGILISTIPVAYSNAQISLRYMFQPNGYSGLGLNNSLYVVTADDLSNIENIIIPEVYDDGENGSSMVAFGSLSQYDTGNINYSVKSVKINTTLCRYSSVSGSDRPFRYLGALEKIEFAYSGKDFMLVEDLFRFTTPNKADSETLKEVHINAESVILNNPDVFRNRDSAITAKIYVKNENVKNTILNETAKGDYAVNADQVIIKTVVTDKFAALNEALEKAIIYKQSNYTMSSYEILSNAVLSGSELKKNLEASEESINNAITAINNAIRGLVKRDFIEFDKVLAQAEDILNNHKYEYSAESIMRLTRYVNDAKKYKESVTGEISESVQMQINSHENNIQSEINSLIALDKTEVFNELKQTIETAESYDKDDFIETSYAGLATALEDAKKLTEESSFEELTLAKQAIETALENLEINPGIIEEPGEPFINIKKGGTESELINKKAEEAMNGAVKVKLTFDCAEDVNFNKYASIELKAIIAGTESYAKIVGTVPQDEAVNGEKGIVVELPLTNPIATGDDVRLTAYTWAWNGAKEHVYGITKVEFFDAYGHAMYAITDRTIAMDKLKAEIEKAEKTEQGNYSDESFAELTKAIESAKALPDNASKSDIDKAINALDKAVKGLKEPTPTEPATPPTKQEPSNNSQPTKPTPAKPSATTNKTRSNADVIKDKKTAQKLMKQAKITKLKANSKSKKMNHSQ